MSLKVMYIALVAFAARGATTPDRVMDDKKIRTAVNCHLDEKCPSEDYYGAIGSWDTSRVTDMSELFCSHDLHDRHQEDEQCAYHNDRASFFFGDDISSWNVAKVVSMKRMFRNTLVFNQPLNAWDVSRVTDMTSMFEGAQTFKHPLNDWDVSNVVDMTNMFRYAIAFNQPLDNWDVPRSRAATSLLGYPLLVSAAALRSGSVAATRSKGPMRPKGPSDASRRRDSASAAGPERPAYG